MGFALGAELVGSVGHSSATANSPVESLSDASSAGFGIMAEERIGPGELVLSVWEEVQSNVKLPAWAYPVGIQNQRSSTVATTASFLPLELGIRPCLRLGIFEPHLGGIASLLVQDTTILGLGGDVGFDVKLGDFLLGADFRAIALVDSQYTSLLQGVISARWLLL